MPLQFTITLQGRRALETDVLLSMDLDEGLLAFIEVNEPVTLEDIDQAFPRTPLRISANQLLMMRRMGLIEQREV